MAEVGQPIDLTSGSGEPATPDIGIALTWPHGQRRGYRTLKRVLDLSLAAGVLIVLSPVLVVAGVLVRREDGGPVLYRTERVGLGGVPFRMYKFRTMVVDADQLGGSSTAKDDPRVTRIGARLRHWKIDELPQLLNVLRGEMSLVGPRPQVPVAVAAYSPAEVRLLSVLPGVTDWASIVFRDEGELLAGFHDPDLAYEQLVHAGKSWLGLEYVARASVRVDLEILIKTLAAVLGMHPKTQDVPLDADRLLGLNRTQVSWDDK